MKIIALKGKPDAIYSCISYLVRGNWNRLNNKNTLIDETLLTVAKSNTS